jgi:hypothetical protein
MECRRCLCLWTLAYSTRNNLSIIQSPITGLPETDLTQRKTLTRNLGSSVLLFWEIFGSNISFLTLNKSYISIQGVMKS